MDWGEVEEALVLVRAGKVGRGAGKEDEPLAFLQKVDDEDKGQWVGLTVSIVSYAITSDIICFA